MSTRVTIYTFPENLEITEEMVFQYTKVIDFDFHKKLCDLYSSENIHNVNKELFNILKTDFLKEGAHYGWDSRGKGNTIYRVISDIMDNKELKRIFKFIEIDEEWSEEGSDDYHFYEYRSTDKVIDEAISEIKSKIKILEKYNKKVIFTVS